MSKRKPKKPWKNFLWIPVGLSVIVFLFYVREITPFRKNSNGLIQKNNDRLCDFHKFDNNQTIYTLQESPPRGLIVHSKENKNVIQIYDISIILDYIKNNYEPCKPAGAGSFYIDKNGERVDLTGSTKFCDEEGKNWLVTKSFLYEYQKDVDYDSLVSKIENYNFPRENDSINILSMISYLISNSLKKGNVVIKDPSGEVVSSIIYKSSGTANCVDTFGESSYELPDGTVFEKDRLGF